MASRDVQDILGISADTTPRPRPKKKAKVALPRPEGVSREVLALYGERAPPVPIEDPKQYKAKRSLPTVKTSWQRTQFRNQARTDDLLLRHWHQKRDPIRLALPEESETTTAVQTPKEEALADTIAGEKHAQETMGALPVEDGEYRFAKYNLQIDPPRYERKLYDSELTSESWSQEETEYLLELHKDFYGKWPLISDRYEFKPEVNEDVKGGGHISIFQERTMEDMKARFYEVSAKLIAHHTPLSSMTQGEFENHEKMVRFNPRQETERKRQQEALLSRTKDEKKEEDYLLAELRRIYIRQRRNEDERADLRERLDHSLTDSIQNGPTYTSSAEINALFQKMLLKDKNQKAQRRSIMEEVGAAGATPNQNGSGAGAGTSGSTIQASNQKRASIAPGATPVRRPLNAASEVRFGVTTHDRLTSGVSFRSDKLLKLRQAKSAAQTQKIATILSELQVPDLVQMPSMAVCGAMERLVSRITLLIEARRTKEKDENDLAVAKQLKGLKGGNDGGENDAKPKVEEGTRDGDVEMVDGDANAQADGNGEEEAEENEEANEEENEEENNEENEEENDDEQEEEEEEEEQEEEIEETQVDLDVDNDSEMEQASSEREEEEEQAAADALDEDEQADSEREEEEEQAAADAEAAAAMSRSNGVGDDDEGDEEEEEEEDQEDDEEDDEEEDDGNEADDKDGGSAAEEVSVAPTMRSRSVTKRSASVLSAGSGGSGGAVGRARKKRG